MLYVFLIAQHILVAHYLVYSMLLQYIIAVNILDAFRFFYYIVFLMN